MDRKTSKNEWPLIRFIVPVFPEVNIFTRQAKAMTALGPLIVATAANKVWEWRAEVIDENNYKGPRDSQRLPDHQALQKESPAAVVGFYCGLSSPMERVWDLAEFYRQQGVLTIAGGWHTHYCPEESLRNNIDLIVHGDGEIVIQQIIRTFGEGESLGDISGISFLEDGEVKTNPPEMLEIQALDDLPFPDYGLLKFSGKIKTYSIGRTRGCGMNCEFCSVKGIARSATAQHLFRTVNWLVETRKAREFFIVDDRLEEDLPGTIEFFHLVAERYGRQLTSTAQVRLESAKNAEFRKAMKGAGVKNLCIGYESPDNEDLKAMRKGYRSSNMLEWTRVYQRDGFSIHGMFIFGYPLIEGKILIGAKERVKRFERFIRKAHFNSLQVLHAVPLVGTDLRKRLEKEGRIFPLDLVPWSKYDGNYPCFLPDDMTAREFQEMTLRIMKGFYSPIRLGFFKILWRAVNFPDGFIRGWENWKRSLDRELLKTGGRFFINRWQERQRGKEFLKRLEDYQAKQDLTKGGQKAR